MLTAALTAAQVERYRADGVLVVPGVVTGAELAALQGAADRVQVEAVDYGRSLDRERPVQLTEEHGFSDWREFDDRKFLYARGPGGERVWRRAEGMWQRDPSFRTVTAHPGILGVVAALGDGERVPAHDSLVVKMPGSGAAVPWHRDPPGERLVDTCGDATGDFICDLYLDDSTVANGCVWAIAGSHRDRSPVPADALDFSAPRARPLEAAAGDLLIHSTGVLHGSPENASTARRRTFYLHYVTPEALAGFWWERSPEWIEQMRRFAEECRAERARRELPGATPASAAHAR